jgi:RNA polymerase sigma factor for flagellar operon FliA
VNGPEALADTVTLPAYAGLDRAQVSVVASSAQAAAARAVLEQADALGFDTESRPTFLRGEASSGPHLVQLATDNHCFLYQVDHLDAFDDLNALLASPRLVKAGFGLGDDLRRLASKCGIACAGTVDLAQRLREGRGGPGGRNAVGVKTAVADLLGQHLQKSKKVATTNWASRVLSERQILYAANDAHAALRVYRAWLARDSAHRP